MFRITSVINWLMFAMHNRAYARMAYVKLSMNQVQRLFLTHLLIAIERWLEMFAGRAI